MNKRNQKGFTLMEMLIVIAIIAILVAIAIPTFTSALTRAKEATDAANVRAAYAQIMIENMLENKPIPTAKSGITDKITELGSKLNYDANLTVEASGDTVTITYKGTKIFTGSTEDPSLTLKAKDVTKADTTTPVTPPVGG